MTYIEDRHSFSFIESNPESWIVLNRGLAQDIMVNHLIAQLDQLGHSSGIREAIDQYRSESNHDLLLHLAAGDGLVELAERSGAIKFNA
jgi:hypothetical protein